MSKILSYEQIYKFDIELMEYIQEKYRGNGELSWRIFYEFYEDPDGHPVGDDFRKICDVVCTADGLMSVNRIYEFENGFNEDFISVFRKYRKIPIFFFPREQRGINQSRYHKCTFDDRMDYTLFDIKTFYDNEMNAQKCILKRAFELDRTRKWLEKMGSFANLIGEYDISGIFTDKKGNVFDIENGGILKEIPTERVYSKMYYDNLKVKIDEWNRRKKILKWSRELL